MWLICRGLQEAAVLRRKVEELEQDRETLKRQVKELTDKVATITPKTNTTSIMGLRRNSTTKSNNLAEEKVKVKIYAIFLHNYNLYNKAFNKGEVLRIKVYV